VAVSLTETIIGVLLNLFSYEYFFFHPGQILCFKRKPHYCHLSGIRMKQETLDANWMWG